MSLIRAGFGVLVGLIVLQGIASSQITAPVGERGDPERLAIQGTAAFSADEVKAALLKDFDVLLAAHPCAPILEYADMLRRKVRAGFRQAGFPDASASVVLNPGTNRIELTVKEGPRYLAGEVKVKGAKSIPVERLIERLTRPYPPKDAVVRSFAEHRGETAAQWVDKDGKEVKLHDPVWKPGKPAPFPPPALPKNDPPKRKIAFPDGQKKPQPALHGDVADALADLGYCFPEFAVDVVASPNGKTADLVIDVLNEGPGAVVGKIEVTGNSIHSRDEVLRCAAVEPGAAVDREQCVRIKQRLWRTGRFVKVDVTPLRAVAPDDKVLLRIDLSEYEHAPPLSRPLSPEEEVLLKLRDWLANPQRWTGDLRVQVTAREGTFCAAISPRRGVVASIKYLGTGEAIGGGLSPVSSDENGTVPLGSAGEPPVEYSLIMSLDEIGVYSIGRGRKLAGERFQGQLVGSIGLALGEKPQSGDEGGRSKFNVGFWFHSPDKDNPQPPFRLSTEFEPAAFLAMAHEGKAECTLRDGVLSVKGEGTALRVDASSGQLLDFVLTERRGEGKQGEQRVFRLSFVPGEFDRRLNDIRTSAAKYPNDFDPKQPVSSILWFFCDEAWLWRQSGVTVPDERALRVLRAVLLSRALEAVDDLVVKSSDAKEGRFTIPADPVPDFAPPPQAIMEVGARLAMVSCNALFPRDSWPWTVSREAAMVATGKAKYTDAELDKLYQSNANGPICYLVTGTLLERVNLRAAQLFAAKGLTRLSIEDFRKEYDVFLDRRHVIGQCAARVADVFRELDEEDVQLLSTMVSPEYAPFFERCVGVLRLDRGRPIDKALPELLDQLWTVGLQQRVKAALDDLKKRATPEGSQGSAEE